MATNSITLIDGTVAYASDVEDKVNPLYTDIDNSNIAAAAGIVFSKLDALTVMGLATVQTVTGEKTFSAATTFSANVSIGTNADLLPLTFFDDTNNRVYFGNSVTTAVDGSTFEHQHTIAGAGTFGRVVISTATGTTGVVESSWHKKALPLDNDSIYQYKFYGNNDAVAIKEYARFTVRSDDVSAATEDGLFFLSLMKAGTLTTTLYVASDQVHVRPGSLVVGTNTNIGPDGTAQTLYVKSSIAASNVLFESTESGATGLYLDFWKNSSTPFAGDEVARIRFRGNDSGGNAQSYGDIRALITDTTNGSEDGEIQHRVVVSGTVTTYLSAVSTAGAVEVTVTGQLTVVGNTNSITSTNSSGDAVTITASSLTTGSALRVYSNSSSNSSRHLVEITNDNTSADATACLYIQQDGGSESIVIEANGDGESINIISTGDANSEILVQRSANTASDVYGIAISGSNAGAGDYVGISFSSGLDALFKTFDASAGALGAFSGSFLMVDSGGTTRKVPYYAV